MQSKEQMIKYFEEMLKNQKKETDDRILALESNLYSMRIKENEKNKIISNLKAKVDKLQKENQLLKSPLIPVENSYVKSEVSKVESSDDESADSQQKEDSDLSSVDEQQKDKFEEICLQDPTENSCFLPVISDEVRSYPWEPGRGFLDTVAYHFECREHKRAIHALKTAAYEGDHEALKKVIQEKKYTHIDSRGMADSLCSRVRGFYDKTALTLAAQEGHLKCVKILLAHNADINKLDRENLTPLDYAQENSHLEVVDFLKKHHALTGKEVVDTLEKTPSPEMKFKIN